MSRLRRKVGGLLKPSNVGAWHKVRDQLNALLRGWSNYFRCGSRYVQFRAVDHYVYDRVVHFQRRRHQTQSRGTTQYSEARVFGELGVLRLRDMALGVGSVRYLVKSVGKPDALIGHVRFDERGRETAGCL